MDYTGGQQHSSSRHRQHKREYNVGRSAVVQVFLTLYSIVLFFILVKTCQVLKYVLTNCIVVLIWHKTSFYIDNKDNGLSLDKPRGVREMFHF